MSQNFEVFITYFTNYIKQQLWNTLWVVAYLVAPLEVGILHKRPVSELSLEEVVHILCCDGFENNVEFGKVIGGLVLLVVVAQALGKLAERADGVADGLVFDGDGEVVGGAVTAAFVIAAWHRDNLHEIELCKIGR
jgi:hypothetical protein